MLREAEEQIDRILAPRLKADAKIGYGLRAVATPDVDPEEIEGIYRGVARKNLREVSKSLPAQLLARVTSGVPQKTLDRFRRENVALIKSLVGVELEQITELLDEGFAKGARVEDLRAQIKERFNVSKSKADLLARDQVLKANAAITQTRQKQAGIVSYTWSTSSDERVRPMHDDLEGTVQQWDDPPVTNENGDRNHPGEDIQCRCIALPILPPLDEAG